MVPVVNLVTVIQWTWTSNQAEKYVIKHDQYVTVIYHSRYSYVLHYVSSLALQSLFGTTRIATKASVHPGFLGHDISCFGLYDLLGGTFPPVKHT